MKKGVLRIVLVLLAVMLMSATFAACGLTDEESAVVGKFELVEIVVSSSSSSSTADPKNDYSYITAESYEYYNMEFKSNRKCVISRKTDGQIYNVTATWSMNSSGAIEIVTVKNRAKATEIYTLNQHTLTGINSVVADGKNLVVNTTFIRTYE